MPKIALDAKLYIGASGSGGVTYSDAMNNVMDLTLTLEYNEGEISNRGSWCELFKPTMAKMSLEFEMFWDEDDTDFAAILAAWVDRTELNIKCLSSDDGSGVEGEFHVFKLDRNESLKDVIKASVTIKPTYVTRYPTWQDAT